MLYFARVYFCDQGDFTSLSIRATVAEDGIPIHGFMRLCPLLFVLAGCFDVSQPTETAFPVCGDGVCSAEESALFCPQDCATPGGPALRRRRVLTGRDRGRCPADCTTEPPPPPGVPRIELGRDAAGRHHGHDRRCRSTLPDTASCGVATSAPAATYAWRAPSAGHYAISATAGFAIVLSVDRGACGDGDELDVQPRRSSMVALQPERGDPLITITGARRRNGSARQPS